MSLCRTLACGTALLLLTLSGPEESAAKSDKFISVDDISVGQPELGHYAAEERLGRWEAEAREKGVDLIDHAPKIAAEQREVEVPVFIDPTGKKRATDRHHRVKALLALADRYRKAGRGELDIKLRLKVDRDYRPKKDWDKLSQKKRDAVFAEYAEDAVERYGLAHFADGTIDDPVAFMRRFPDEFSELKDNPLRSVVGSVLRRADLRGSHFLDYIQFRIGDKLIEDGIVDDLRRRGLFRGSELPWDAAGNPSLVDAVEDVVFGRESYIEFLEDNIPEGKKGKKAKKTRKRLRKHAKVIEERRAQQRGKRRPTSRRGRTLVRRPAATGRAAWTSLKTHKGETGERRRYQRKRSSLRRAVQMHRLERKGRGNKAGRKRGRRPRARR